MKPAGSRGRAAGKAARRRSSCSSRRAWLFLFLLLTPGALLRAVSPGDVVVNEIMYDPAGSDSYHEWVEVYNKSAAAIDLTGWTFREAGTDHALNFVQGGSTLAAGGYAIIADSAAKVIGDYSGTAAVASGMVIDSAFSLSNSGESLALLDDSSVMISSLAYSSAAPWPVLSASGRSLERISASGADNSAANWAEGPSSGTPNALNSAAGGGGGSGGGGGGGGGTVTTEADCSDGLDDDGDGRVDCDDSDCAAAAACRTGAAETFVTAKTLEVDDSLNPFAPSDTDPAFRAGRIFFNVGSPDVVKTVRIVNVRGETVRVLVDNDTALTASFSGKASGSVTWDGLDDAGAPVPLGLYIAHMEGVDPANGSRVTASDTIAVGREF